MLLEVSGRDAMSQFFHGKSVAQGPASCSIKLKAGSLERSPDLPIDGLTFHSIAKQVGWKDQFTLNQQSCTLS